MAFDPVTEQADKPKRKVGRPTDYREEYCEQVMQWGREGKSRAWMCSELDIARSTLQEWEKAHEEFKDALQRAKDHEQRFWEDLGGSYIKDRNFNAQIWIRSMAARFPGEWRENKKIEQTTQEVAPVVIQGDDAKLL